MGGMFGLMCGGGPGACSDGWGSAGGEGECEEGEEEEEDGDVEDAHGCYGGIGQTVVV